MVLRFDRLAQPWLKEAAKRWARARLLASLSPRSMERYLRELIVFSRWLADRNVGSPGSITRELLEDYMLYVRTRPWAQSTRRRRLGALRAFLEEQRRARAGGAAADGGDPVRGDAARRLSAAEGGCA